MPLALIFAHPGDRVNGIEYRGELEPMVVVPEPTTAESIEAERQSDAAFYQGIKAKGGLANEVLGETGLIFNQAGYGIAHGVNSLYNLAADSEFRSQALAGVGNALGDGIDFLGQGASALYSLASDSSARSQFATDVGYAFENRNELARSALNYVKSVDYGLLGENLAIGTVETIATLGAGKLAVQGGKGALAFPQQLSARFGGAYVANSGKLGYLSPGEFAEFPRAGVIDPSRIRFSQGEISPSFQPPYGALENFVSGLKNGSIDPSGIKPIRIVEKDGQIFSLDNRRLYSFQEAGIEIPYLKLDAVPKRQLFKFDTQNQGTSVFVRPGKN